MTTEQEHREMLEALEREPNPHADMIAQAQEIDRRFRAEQSAKRRWVK